MVTNAIAMPSSISSGATSAQKQTDLTSWVPKQFVARVHISSTAGDDEDDFSNNDGYESGR